MGCFVSHDGLVSEYLKNYWRSDFTQPSSNEGGWFYSILYHQLSTSSTYHDGKYDPQADACGESPARNESEDARPDFENAEHDDVDDDDNCLDLYMMPDHVK